MKGYLECGNEQCPIGIPTSLIDVNGQVLHTGDVILLKLKDCSGEFKSIIFTEDGQMIGSCMGYLSQKGIQKHNVEKIRSYKDLKNNEEINVFTVKLNNVKFNNASKSLSDYTNIELLEELKRRLK